MRKLLLAFSLLLLSGAPAVLGAVDAGNPEEPAVREAIQQYLHGLKFNDVDSLKKAFYPEAKLFFVKKNGELGQLTQAEWYKGFEGSAGKEETGELQVASMDITGNIASVKVEEDYPTSHYTDYVALLKLNNEWKIVNKVFYARKK